MAGYKSAQVNVGSLINPTESLSRSLSDLSTMYGRQATAEQNQLNREADKADRAAREAKALDRQLARDQLAQSNLIAGREESARRFEIGQQHIADKAAAAKKKADGIELGNRFFINANEGRNPDLKVSDYDSSMQKEFSRLRDSWNAQEKASRRAVLSGNPEDIEAAVSGMLSGKGTDKRDFTASQNTRRSNLAILNRAVLDAKTPAEKEAIIDKGMKDIYGGRRAELDRSIAEGSFLTNKQKVNALMRYVPKEYLEAGGDAATMQRNLLATMSGTTKQEMITAENARVSARNKEMESTAKADIARYKAELKARKGKSDWKGLTKLLEKDLGNFDNDDKADIIDFMISEGVPHDQIGFAVNRLISESSNLFGDSIPDADDPRVLKMVTGITSKMRKEGKLSGKPIARPSGYTPEVPRSIEDIQKSLFRRSGNKVGSTIQLQEGWDKYKTSKDTLTPPVVEPAANILDAPSTGTPVPGPENNYYRDVPLGDNEQMSPEEVEWNRQRAEKFNSTGSQLKRAGRDALNFIDRLPAARAAAPVLNLFRAGNLGTKAVLPALTKGSKAARAKASRQFADEAYSAAKAAKEAALNPVRQVVKPTVRSKSDLRVDQARKKVWNNDKVNKETTDMWDNYWLANIKG